MAEKLFIVLFANSNRKITKLISSFPDASYYGNKFYGKGKYYYVEDTAENRLKAKELKLSVNKEGTVSINRIMKD